MHPLLIRDLAHARHDELLRQAERRRLVTHARRKRKEDGPVAPTLEETAVIHIRPVGDLLLAEVDGAAAAALSPTDGVLLSAANAPVAELLELLELRAAQLRPSEGAGEPSRLRRFARSGSHSSL